MTSILPFYLSTICFFAPLAIFNIALGREKHPRGYSGTFSLSLIRPISSSSQNSDLFCPILYLEWENEKLILLLRSKWLFSCRKLKKNKQIEWLSPVWLFMAYNVLILSQNTSWLGLGWITLMCTKVMMTKEDVLQPVRQAMLSVFTISGLWRKGWGRGEVGKGVLPHSPFC